MGEKGKKSQNERQDAPSGDADNTSAQAGKFEPLLLWGVVVVMLVGAGIGVLMTWHHEQFLYGEVEGDLMGCESNEEVNCDVVNASEYSEFLGVPIAAWGFATYLTIAVIAILAWRGRRDGIPLLFLAGVATVLYAIFLYYISKSQLGYVCLWCIRLYIVNGLLMALALGLKGWRKPWPTPATWGIAVGVFVALSVVAIAGARMVRASLLGEGGGVELSVELATPDEEPDGKGKVYEADPEGDCPPRTLTITTEDGNDVEITLPPTMPWRGNPDASVVVIDLNDLECGYCKRVSLQLAKVYAAYEDRVLFVSLSYPMDPACNPGVNNKRHRDACNATRAQVCAGRQDKFWAFHKLAFKNAHELDADALRLYADTVGVDLAQYDQCLADPSSHQQVYDEASIGKTLEVHGTPRMYINGKLYRGGRSAEQIARQIEIALGAAPADAAKAAQAMRGESDAVQPIAEDVAEMQTVEHGDLSFKIDTFEAALTDGKAVVGTHEIPATRMSWFAAKEACEAVGKRMCTEREWLTACQGAAAVDDDGDGEFADDMVEGTTYPYSDFHAPGRCWDGKQGEQWRPVYTGEMPGCASSDGVYDLTGNVEEWVGATPEAAVLMGGAYDTSKDHARCYRRNDTFGPGYASQRTGFRCCQD